MKKQCVVVLGSLILSASCAAAEIANLTWLSGQWCGTSQGIYSEESWLEPRARSMVGMHRDTKDGKFLAFEFFRIVEDGVELVYWTQPQGRPAIAFRAAVVDKDRVDFLNLAHDFPKRITYRRRDSNTLVARIDDGTDTGKNMEWIWRRDCPGR